MFAGEIKVLNDLWIIGNSFMHKNYFAYPSLKDEVKLSRQPLPYAFEYYNVSAYYATPDALIKDVLARFYNALVSALNGSLKLPRILLVVPNEDRIKFVNFSLSGTCFVFSGVISWIVTNMNRAIEGKCDFLLRHHAGAVLVNESKVIWVKPFKCAYHSADQRVLINKFNMMLEEVLADHENSFIIEVDAALHSESFFTGHNSLNSHGQKAFWSEVDKMIEKFEKKKINL